MIRDRLRARGLAAAIGLLSVVGMLSASVVVAQAMAAQEQEKQEEQEKKRVKESEHSGRLARRLHEQMRRIEEETSRGRHQRGLGLARMGRIGLRRGGMSAEGILAQAEDLALSDGQADQIRGASKAHRRAGIKRNADIQIAELDLKEMLADVDTADLNAVEAQMQEIASLRVEDRIAGLRLRQQVRGVLSPEQREQLEEERGHNVFMLRRGGEGPHVWSFGDGDGEFEFNFGPDFEGLESLDWVKEFRDLPFGTFEFRSKQKSSESGDHEGEESEGVARKKSNGSVGVVTL